MIRNANLCTGVIGELLFEDELENGWKTSSDLCVLGGLTLLHKKMEYEIFVLKLYSMSTIKLSREKGQQVTPR